MKKVLTGILVVVFLFSVGAISVIAASAGRGSNFVDADQDGVCDNRDVTNSTSGNGFGYNNHFVDADQDGVCDNNAFNGSGNGDGSCRGNRFVDADQDGICDYEHTRAYSRHGKGRSSNK